VRIADLRTFVVGTPPPHHGGAYWIFVKLVTDTGLEGVGEVYGVPFAPSVVVSMIEDVVARQVLGADPFAIEQLTRRIYSSNYTQRPDPSLGGVLSGVELACWDLVGKEVGRPVYELLGGRVRDRVRTYTYIYPDPDEPFAGNASPAYTVAEVAAERAAHYAGLGFTALKFDPVGAYSAFDPRHPQAAVLAHVVHFVGTLRDAVGGGVDLLVGTHGQLTAAAAIRLARRLEPFDPMWLEEPVPPENPAELGVVARGTSIPIATGERLTTLHEFARVLEAGGAAFLQPAIGRAGGLLQTKKIAALAESRYAQLAPHLYAGPIEGAANLQLAACTPNVAILEGLETWTGFGAQLLRTPLHWEDGYLIPPDGPGLGVELDEDVALAHAYSGTDLHLSMTDHPVD
jgi:galactonate dehydratase